jgi:hypothetical protein
MKMGRLLIPVGGLGGLALIEARFLLPILVIGGLLAFAVWLVCTVGSGISNIGR